MLESLGLCDVCGNPAVQSHINMISFRGEDGWRYMENDGPVTLFCEHHTQSSTTTPREKWLELEEESNCNQKDRADYMTRCCDRERQRADDLEFPMRAIIRILDERCPNWRSRHIDHCDQIKAAYEVDFIISEHARLFGLISEYIRVEKEILKEMNRPWWKRLLRIK